MSYQISFYIYNEKSDINVYQSEQRVDEIHYEQKNNICTKCGNDHSYKSNFIHVKSSFDIFQELIDNYCKNQELANKNQKVT